MLVAASYVARQIYRIWVEDADAQRSDSMKEEKDDGNWYITVHGVRRGPYPGSGAAHIAASAAKKAEPNKHVAVLSPQGISIPVDE